LAAPRYTAIAQWIDHPTAFARQVWLVCFDVDEHTDYHLHNRNWIWKASQDIGWNLAMNAVTATPRGPPQGAPPTPQGNPSNNNNRPPNANKPTNNNNVKKGNKNGKGRKGKSKNK
jgi:hypothetical protein